MKPGALGLILLVSHSAHAFQRRIVGGEDVGQSVPWMASLRNASASYQHYCGGSLIGESWALTTAHCALAGNGVNDYVYANGQSLNGPFGYQSRIAEVICNPDYNPTTLSNNICLLRLESPATGVTTIPLNADPVLDTPGQEATALGWGQTSRNSQAMSEQLQYVAMAIATTRRCARTYGDLFNTTNSICLDGNGTRDACVGDNGGPIIANSVNENPVLVGVYSWSTSCARRNEFALGEKVSAYVDWITSVVGQGAVTSVKLQVPPQIAAAMPPPFPSIAEFTRPAVTAASENVTQATFPTPSAETTSAAPKSVAPPNAATLIPSMTSFLGPVPSPTPSGSPPPQPQGGTALSPVSLASPTSQPQIPGLGSAGQTQDAAPQLPTGSAPAAGSATSLSCSTIKPTATTFTLLILALLAL